MTTLYNELKNKSNEVLKIFYAEGIDNPLEDMDTLFNYYTWNGNYSSIQENTFHSIEEFVDDILGDEKFSIIRDKCIQEGKSKVEFIKHICKELDRNGIVAFPILSYEHSSISYYLGNYVDRFDGGIAGLVWAKKEKLYAEYGIKRITRQKKDTFKTMISNDLEMYSDWVNGEVFGYKFYVSGEEVDSCYGFYNSNDDLLEQIISYLPTSDTEFEEVLERIYY